MESSKPKSPAKLMKSRSTRFVASPIGEVAKSISPQQSVKANSWVSRKHLTKENTKPLEIKLHSEERAIKRALFNDWVATKLYLMEEEKRQFDKLQKMIEDEEVRMLRKEMIPKAQWMPLFDRPFFPHRSTAPLTIPKEPSLRVVARQNLSCPLCREKSVLGRM